MAKFQGRFVPDYVEPQGKWGDLPDDAQEADYVFDYN